MKLSQLRKRLGLTQTDVADRMGVAQNAVSRLELQCDVRLSTLRKYAKALNGELRIVVQLPDGSQIEIELGGP